MEKVNKSKQQKEDEMASTMAMIAILQTMQTEAEQIAKDFDDPGPGAISVDDTMAAIAALGSQVATLTVVVCAVLKACTEE